MISSCRVVRWFEGHDETCPATYGVHLAYMNVHSLPNGAVIAPASLFNSLSAACARRGALVAARRASNYLRSFEPSRDRFVVDV